MGKCCCCYSNSNSVVSMFAYITITTFFCVCCTTIARYKRRDGLVRDIVSLSETLFRSKNSPVSNWKKKWFSRQMCALDRCKFFIFIKYTYALTMKLIDNIEKFYLFIFHKFSVFKRQTYPSQGAPYLNGTKGISTLLRTT